MAAPLRRAASIRTFHEPRSQTLLWQAKSTGSWLSDSERDRGATMASGIGLGFAGPRDEARSEVVAMRQYRAFRFQSWIEYLMVVAGWRTGEMAVRMSPSAR